MNKHEDGREDATLSPMKIPGPENTLLGKLIVNVRSHWENSFSALSKQLMSNKYTWPFYVCNTCCVTSRQLAGILEGGSWISGYNAHLNQRFNTFNSSGIQSDTLDPTLSIHHQLVRGSMWQVASYALFTFREHLHVTVQTGNWKALSGWGVVFLPRMPCACSSPHG